MSTPKTLPHHTSDWKGYSIDELRYMRAYTAARIEINRDRLTSRVAAIKKNGLTGAAGTGSMIGKMFSAVGYFDLALMGWKMSRRVLKTFRLFRRK